MKPCAIDLEFYGVTNKEELHWHQAEFACMSYYSSPDDCGVIFSLDELKEFFDVRRDFDLWVIHNAMFDVLALRALGIELRGKLWDTMIVEKVLYSNYYSGFSLQDLAARHLDLFLEKDAYEALSTKKISREALQEYALTDAVVAFQIYEKQLETLLNHPKLLNVYTHIEEPVLWAFMDFKPVPVDAEAWLIAAEQFEREYHDLVSKLGINVRSPVQVKDYLQKHKIKVESTEEDELAKHAGNPVVDAILKARGLSKAYTTYGKEWVEKYVRNGYVHACWHTYGTVTGRASCSNPNLQQIPSSTFPIYRTFFKAKEGMKIVVADIAAQEPRIAALLSGDEALINIFKNNGDIHTEVARAIFNDPTITKEKDKEKRQIGKRIGLGVTYGLTPKGLMRNLKADGIEITLDEATKFINTFFARFPKLAMWLNQQKSMAGSWVYTQSGRRVFVNTLNANLGMNAPIQGTGADMMKLWLNSLHRMCRERSLDYPVIMAVHDEIVLHVPEDKTETYVDLLQRAFIEAQDVLFPSRPFDFKMEYAVGDAWSVK